MGCLQAPQVYKQLGGGLSQDLELIRIPHVLPPQTDLQLKQGNFGGLKLVWISGCSVWGGNGTKMTKQCLACSALKSQCDVHKCVIEHQTATKLHKRWHKLKSADWISRELKAVGHILEGPSMRSLTFMAWHRPYHGVSSDSKWPEANSNRLVAGLALQSRQEILHRLSHQT